MCDCDEKSYGYLPVAAKNSQEFFFGFSPPHGNYAHEIGWN